MCERIEENRHSIGQIIFINSEWTDSILLLFVYVLCKYIKPHRVVSFVKEFSCRCRLRFLGRLRVFQSPSTQWTNIMSSVRASAEYTVKYLCSVNRYFGDTRLTMCLVIIPNTFWWFLSSRRKVTASNGAYMWPEDARRYVWCLCVFASEK